VDPRVLVRFAIKKVEEVKNPERREPPAIWIALILAAVSEEDHEFYDRLKDMVSSTANNAQTILKMKDLFISALGLSQDESHYSDEKDAYPFPDERICKQILRYARREGTEMIASRNYGNVAVFRVLMKAGLEFSSWRFAQFEEICESFNSDLENLVRKGLEIIRVVTYTPRNKN
jgi:hypothetical protein